MKTCKIELFCIDLTHIPLPLISLSLTLQWLILKVINSLKQCYRLFNWAFLWHALLQLINWRSYHTISDSRIWQTDTYTDCDGQQTSACLLNIAMRRLNSCDCMCMRYVSIVTRIVSRIIQLKVLLYWYLYFKSHRH